MGNLYSIKIISLMYTTLIMYLKNWHIDEVLPRLELGLLDSESKVLTITP